MIQFLVEPTGPTIVQFVVQFGCLYSISSTIYYQIFADILVPKNPNPKHSFVTFGVKISYKKCTRKILMKLTTRFLTSRKPGFLAPLTLRVKN